MRRLIRAGLVEADAISTDESVDAFGELFVVAISGRVICTAGVMVSLDNRLDVQRGIHNRYEVRPYVYRYHAWHEINGTVRDILRYDNGHGSALHRHVFDSGGVELRREPVGPGALPTLDSVVREAVALVRSWLLSSR